MFNLIKKIFNKNKVHDLKIKEINFSDLVQILKEEKYGKCSQECLSLDRIREIKTFVKKIRDENKYLFYKCLDSAKESDFVDGDFEYLDGFFGSFRIPSNYFIDLEESEILKEKEIEQEKFFEAVQFYSNPNFRCGKIEEKEEDQS